MKREAVLGVLAGVGVLLVFSGFLVVSRVGVHSSLTIYDMTGLRIGVAALAAAPLLARTRLLHLTWPRAVWIAITSGAPLALFAFLGMSFAPVAHAGIVINGAMPVFAALIGWIVFAEWLGRWRVAGIALSLVGVSLTGWDALAFGEPGQWRGHLFFLGTAAFNAAFQASVRGWQIGAAESLVAALGLNALIYIPLWLLFLPSNISAAPWPEIVLQGVYQGVIAAFIAAFLLAYAARTIGAARQSAIMAGAPALATLLAIPVLGEIPSWVSVAGIVTVSAGILITLGPGLLSGAAAPPMKALRR